MKTETTINTVFSDVHQRSSVEYLLRTAQQHHVQLSAMADQKANIIIGASSIVLTLVVSQIRTEGFSMALAMIALTLLFSAVFAVFAVNPGTMGQVPRDKKSFNPLFFGHFATMEEDEYLAHMAKLLKQDETVYEAFLRDIYQNGKVLYARKYRFLSYSYRTFLGGLALTSVAVIIGELIRWFQR